MNSVFNPRQKSGILIQARMSSNRLPGKVLMKIRGLAVLALLVRRCKKAKNIDTAIVVTSDQKDDDAIEDLAEREQVPCFRGSLNDVLKRTIDAAEHFGVQHILRVCGDGPFRLPEIMEKAYLQHIQEGNDYTNANGSEVFISEGLGVEIVALDALKRSFSKSSLDEDREHVTLYIRKHQEEFRCGLFKNRKEYWIDGLRLLIDTEDDYKNVLRFTGNLPQTMPLEEVGLSEMRAACCP